MSAMYPSTSGLPYSSLRESKQNRVFIPEMDCTTCLCMTGNRCKYMEPAEQHSESEGRDSAPRMTSEVRKESAA